MSSQFSMKSYMKGALLLTVAALIVKVLSAVYRVPFQNLVGDQGFYVYQQVYPFIAFFVVWTSGGVAVAISKLLADTNDEQIKHGITKTVFQYLTVLSLLFFALLFFGAHLLSSWMGDPLLAPLLQTGAFVTLCMPALAVMKGTFQSRAMMEPVAYAQVFEQTVRVVMILIGTIVVVSLLSQSVYAAGNMAVLGTVIGELAGVILLFVYMKKKALLSKETVAISKWPIIKEVTIFSISVSMSSLLLLTYQLVDSFTVFSMLVESGLETLDAMAIKGIYDRGQPLVQLGVVIASSFSLAIVPLVTYKSKQGTRGEVPYIQLTYRASLVFGIAAALGLILVMPYANALLFKTDALSSVLMLYVLQIVSLSIILTFTAILQGYGKLKIPFYCLLGALSLKIGGNMLLIPLIGIAGAAIASNIGLFTCAMLLVYYFKKVNRVILATGSFYKKLLIASISMTVVVALAVVLLNHIISFTSVRMAALVYSAVLISLGAFTFITAVAKLQILSVREWFIIPFGRRMSTYQLWLNKKK
ncbi:putative polysaccharide biosynthesis protein [Lysinibacillus sp. LZ02]|uniref:putative polysaccharide biosynthesis protein n=1 Tax=Lysinibacillus sp. LZ02 TaxID=3420668 RepID=UPI003D35C967